MTIGERIKEARENAHFTQVEMAEKLNISKQLLYKYETNKVQRVPSDVIEKISSLCHVDPWYIMGWDVQEEGQQPYYTDGETAQIAQEVYENPDLKLVFDACKGLSPEQIKAAAAMLNTFKGDK